MCPGGLAYQDRTPQNEQGRGPTTSGLQSPNPPSAPALLRTCCCLHIIQHFFLPYFSSSYYSIYISCSVRTHPNSVHALLRIITHHLLAAPPSSPPEVVPLFPPFCTYKVTLPCTLDHYSLKRTLDWAETSELLPLTSVHLIPLLLVWLQE